MLFKRLLIVLFYISYIALQDYSYSQNNNNINANHTNDKKNAAFFNKLFIEYKDKSPDSAYYFASKALKIAIDEANIEEQAHAYHNIASYYYGLQDTFSIGYTIKAINTYKKTSDTAGLADSYKLLADNYFNFGNTSSAFENYNSALLYYEKLGNINSYTEMQSIIGQIYMQWGEYLNALRCFQKSLAIHEATNNLKNIADDYNNMGFLFNYWKKYEESIYYYSKALKIFESLNDRQSISMVLKFMGNIYKKNGDYSKAYAYYEKALKKLNDTIQSIEASYIFEEIGNTYLIQNKIDNAIIYYNKTYSIRNSLDMKDPINLVALSHAISNLGRAYNNKKNFSLAIEFYQKALKIEKERNHLFSVAQFYMFIAESYNNWGRYNTALEYYKISLDISKKINYKSFILNNYKAISETYKIMKNYEKSLNYYTIYIGLKDSIFNEESHKQITELQSRHEIDKKEKEIQLLNKDKEINDIALKKEEEIVKKQRLVLFVLIIGTIVIAVFSIILLRLYKHKKQANNILASQKEEITTQRDEIEKKSETLHQAYSIIELKNSNITSSIKYAQRIQQAILPSKENMEKLIPESFVLFLPKDIVSGDFYWLDQKGDHKIYFAAVDCTGHGVPGAFMSIHAYNLLDKALNEQQISKPSDILNYLSLNIQKTLQQKDEKTSVKDSMDIALCCFDKQTKILEYSGATQPLIIIRNQVLTEYKPDRHPVGINYNNEKYSYKNFEIKIEKEDVLYIFTDGYADQFGGLNNQKYMVKQLKKTLQDIAGLPMLKQREFLINAFEQWKGKNEQVDDVLVMGVKI